MKRTTVLYLATGGFVLSYLVPGIAIGPPPKIDADGLAVVDWFPLFGLLRGTE